VLETYRAKWPAFREALESPRPLGVNHEASIDAIRAGDDFGAQNQLLTFAYVLALAAQGRDRVSILDWGGGIGHYYAVAKSLYPDLQVDYTCFDVPILVAEGRRLFPEATFLSDMSTVEKTYDLVFASSSLQYAEDWRATLSLLASSTHGRTCVTRVPIALANPSFVSLQRADRHGYGTEYLGWVLNRDELLDAAEAAGLQLLREFFLTGRFSAAGAPEGPIGHRGFLFAPYTGAG
jgi:putative methyltransferase (TIGR04325 family)